MALKDRSLFLYQLQVTPGNSSLDFRVIPAEPIRQATLKLGFYSLTSLMEEVARAMKSAAQLYNFPISADRTISSGLQNRVSITSSSGYLELLFSTGPRATSTIAPLIGFNLADYTLAASYTGASSAGSVLVTTYAFGGFNYSGPEFNQMVFGSVNVSASGLKEAVVFQIQEFISVQFKYEPYSRIASEWLPLWRWMIQQRSLEFTPEVNNPTVFYEVTLESSGAEGKGLGFKMTEMLPQYPFLYDTGALKFRKRVT